MLESLGQKGSVRKHRQQSRKDSVNFNKKVTTPSITKKLKMGLVDLYPDMITYVEMVKGFCNVDRLDDASWLFKAVKEQGCEPNTVFCSVLLGGLCKNGDMERALELLEETEKGGGIVACTLVIPWFCEKGRTSEALEVLDRMEARGCFPNCVMVSCLIERFCAEGRVEEVPKLIDRVIKGGVSYGECCSSFVVSLKRNGQFEEAEKVFRKMINNGLKPDGLACSIVTKGLCLIGRVLDGYISCVMRLGRSDSGLPLIPIFIHFFYLSFANRDIRLRLLSL